MQDVKKYYNEKAPTYDDYSNQLYFKVYDAVTWKIIEPYIPKNSKALVLDAAGGTGKWSIPIAKCGPKVVLVDISDEMLNVARRKIAKEGLQNRIEAKKGDIRKLDFEDETFDLVFCDHALCFIKEQEQAMKELVRVLKRDHPFIVSGQNRYALSLSLVSEDIDFASRVLSNKAQFVMRNLLKVYALSPDEFKHMLEKNGVKIERIVGKVVTMPLALSYDKLTSENYSEEFVKKILKIEFELIDKVDAVSLGGHIQAIGYKQ